MSLSDDEIDYAAKRANWYFDVLYPQTGPDGDWTVFTGHGLKDINSFIGRYETTPDIRVMVDVGTLSESSREATLANIQGIRQAFVNYYGSVNVVSPFSAADASEFPVVFSDGTTWLQNPTQPHVTVS